MLNAPPEHSLNIWYPFCGSDAAVPVRRGSRGCLFCSCPDCDREWAATRTEEEQRAPGPAEDFRRDESGQGHRLPLAFTGCKISCWVDQDGRVDAGAGHDTDHPKIKYELDLEIRRSRCISRSQPLLAQDWSAGVLFDRWAGTAEKLMRLARTGVFDKMSLAKLLRPDKRQAFLQACSVTEKALTEACTAKGEPCLEGGCAVEGEICLQACLAAGARYREACAAAWIDLFQDSDNRVDAWKPLHRSAVERPQRTLAPQ
jgi:hypothetical protein